MLKIYTRSRHVAMVAKFLDDKKPQMGTRTDSKFIDLIQFHLICQMLAKYFLGLSSKGPYVNFEIEKHNFCVVFTYYIKRGIKLGSFM